VDRFSVLSSYYDKFALTEENEEAAWHCGTSANAKLGRCGFLVS
jgi:hypothetical protein